MVKKECVIIASELLLCFTIVKLCCSNADNKNFTRTFYCRKAKGSNRIKTVSSSIRIKEIYFQQSILGVPLTLYIPRKMKI